MVGRPDADRWAVVTLAREGLTRAEIVRRTGFDARFVSRCMAKFQLTGTVADCARSGRKRKRTPVVEKKVVELMRGKRRRSCRVVAQMLKAQGFASIHRNTVWRTAHDQHLRPYRMQRTSRLTPNQKRDRLAFAIAQANRDWSCTVFSDEHVFRQFKAGNPCHDVVWAQHASVKFRPERWRDGLCPSMPGRESRIAARRVYISTTVLLTRRSIRKFSLGHFSLRHMTCLMLAETYGSLTRQVVTWLNQRSSGWKRTKWR